MGRLEAKFSPSFQRDLKKKATRRGWDPSELERLVGLIIENSPSSLEELRRRHNMHSLQGILSAMLPTQAIGWSSGRAIRQRRSSSERGAMPNCSSSSS